MQSNAPTHRLAQLAAMLGLGVACAGAVTAQTQAEKVAAAAERWLASDQAAGDQLTAVVKVLLEEPKVGIAWLAAQLPAAVAAKAEPRAKGVLGLVSHCTLEYLRRQRATDLTFQGQYDALLPLQPVVGDFLFGLLLETPDWYPTTHRIHLVAPLRDLQPRVPAAERLEGVARIAENDRIEPENLRRALAALLWQWGTRQPAQAMVEALVAATGEGDAEERVQTTLELADFYTQLRDHKQAALAHRSAQTLAKGAGVQLKPVAWYAAACVHALLGDVERGMAALTACIDLLASPDLDSSLRLPRAMFDNDPELELLRRQPQWAALLQRAFPTPPKNPPGGR